MAKTKISSLSSYLNLYRCPRTGIAWIEDGSTGLAYSLHPNIDSSGSVAGMRKLGYWGKKDRAVKTNGSIYNIDKYAPEYKTEINRILLENCHCGGNHGVHNVKEQQHG